ncbi:hypothetical protein ASA1KI_06010 [Opitutales bacterium ASA1]|nr:hypothetical protein ASA1KI_06010 [Opitutales bacterium ASA1]
MLDHLRPRHDRFLERVGTISSERIVSTRPTAPGYTAKQVYLVSSSGLEARFAVLRPNHLREDERLPLMVLLAGHRTGRDAVDVVGTPGPIAVAALDYPYDGPERFSGAREALAHLPAMQRALLDTPPATLLALEWLAAQPWVDPERIELVGVSLGTPFAAVAGALEPRFRRVWFLHGGADNRAWLDASLAEDIPSSFLRRPAAALLHLLAHGATFDTERWVARIAPRPIVVVGARQDEGLTRENVQRLHDAATGPRELVWTDGGHVQPNRPAIVRELLDIVTARLDAAGSDPYPKIGY